MVLCGISELKNLLKKQNKNEKIWEHICEIIEDSILEKYAKTLKVRNSRIITLTFISLTK